MCRSAELDQTLADFGPKLARLGQRRENLADIAQGLIDTLGWVNVGKHIPNLLGVVLLEFRGIWEGFSRCSWRWAGVGVGPSQLRGRHCDPSRWPTTVDQTLDDVGQVDPALT